ncbi:Uncharacterized protein RNJ44_02276 [Nakaseomyces bracarensis]|uniref:Cytochrome b5 heme-binding domain-containing protein n=1 Tax=Nakaseomyces bracarensis TaxID=273131 RepID=A0ABR4NN00_9SACH
MHSASKVMFEQMERNNMDFKAPMSTKPRIRIDTPMQASCSTLGVPQGVSSNNKINGGGYRNKVRLAPGHSPLDWHELVSTKGKAGKLVTGLDKIRNDSESLENFKKLNSPQSLILLERGVPTFAIRPPLRVDEEELARHNTPEDCWTVINGKVFSISSYMDFHPGGAKILLDKSAGQDSTMLFNRYHRWISVEKMLETCFVGVYVG